MEKQRPKISKYDLITGVDAYASQTSQNPETSRMVVGFIPSDDGGLYRQLDAPTFASGLPTNGVKRLFEFDAINLAGTLTRFYFAVVQTGPSATTFNLYQSTGGAWTIVSAVGTLQALPSFAKVQSSNLLHLSDGVTNWLFDGSVWLADGFQIPQNYPILDTIFAWGTGGFAAIAGFVLVDANGNLQLVTTPGTAGRTQPNWNTVVGGTTADGTIVYTCLGDGKTPWQPNLVYSQFTAIYDNHGNYQYVSVAGTSAATQPVFNIVVAGTTADNTVTWKNIGKLVPIGGGTGHLIADGEWLPNQTFAADTFVIDPNGNIQWANAGTTSAGTYPPWNSDVGGTTTDNTVTWTNLGPIVDFPIWQLSTTYGLHKIILDSNENFQTVTVGGTSGTTEPVWNVNAAGTTSDGSVTWKNVGTSKLSGLGIVADVGKYYWITYADHTAGRVTESSSSRSSVLVGPLRNGSVKIFPHPGTFTATLGSSNITAVNSSESPGPKNPILTQDMVGKVIYINGTLVGTIQSVNILANSLVLVANSPSNVSGHAVICDARTTHWHLYASESDGSKIGELLYQIPVTQKIDNEKVTDTSPFVGETGSQYTSILRPVRNDPPPTSVLAEVHKYRIFRRRESKPNFFNYTANEEVSSGLNGDPTECVPGTDVNTLSDIVNEQVYPDSSNYIRSLCSHGDALYIGTEKQVIPMYGQSIDDFGLSQVTAFSVGIAGSAAMISTAHGLAFVSYDKKVFIYPTSNYYWAYVPNDVNVTDNLVEIGKPIRKILEQIDPAFINETQLKFYFYGRRNWLVLTMRLLGGTYTTWVYDFTNKGWFELVGSYSSIDVWEIATGNKVLVGGKPSGLNGGVFVIDDLTGTYVSGSNQPNAVWRPALIDFGDPDSKHIPLYIEVEVSNPLMMNDLSLQYYLDPADVDNPGTARTVSLKPAPGANLFRGFFQGGNLCQRLLIEFNMAPSLNTGYFRGIKLVANPASGLIG